MSKKLRLIAPLLVAVSGLTSSACVEPEGNFFVQCFTSVGEDAAGSCDPGLSAILVEPPRAGQEPAAYVIGVVVANRLREDPRVQQSTLQVQSKDILLTEVEVGVEGTSGSVDPVIFPATGLVPASQGTEPGTYSTQIPLPAGMLGSLAEGQTAVLNIRFYGRTTGGDELETPIYYMPIVVPTSGP